MSESRPGFEEVSRRRSWPVADWRFAVVVGLALGLLLVLAPPSTRTHVLGGTDHQPTTVLSAELRDGCDSGQQAVYTVSWDDAGTTRETSYVRCGPLRHEVGDTVMLWVSPDLDRAIADSPLNQWLWAMLAMPVFAVILSWLIAWRQRVFVRNALKHDERQARRWGTQRPS